MNLLPIYYQAAGIYYPGCMRATLRAGPNRFDRQSTDDFGESTDFFQRLEPSGIVR